MRTIWAGGRNYRYRTWASGGWEKQMKRASLGVPLHASDGIRYALGLDTPDAGYIVVGEEETYFQLHDKNTGDNHGDRRKTND